jgi:hypothetical protein
MLRATIPPVEFGLQAIAKFPPFGLLERFEEKCGTALGSRAQPDHDEIEAADIKIEGTAIPRGTPLRKVGSRPACSPVTRDVRLLPRGEKGH